MPKRTVQIQKSGTLLLILLIPLLTGCDNSELREKVAAYQASVDSAKSSVATFYLNVNDQMRDLYVDEIRYRRPSDAGIKIEELVANEVVKDGVTKKVYEPTGLVEYYSKDHIAARLAAMEAISAYTYGLSALIMSDSPQEAKKAIEQTGTELNALNKQISAASAGQVTDLSKFTTPIANLTAIVAEKWLTYSQRKATVESIQNSKDTIKTLCKALEEDVNDVNKSIAGPKASKILSSIKDEYNNNPALVNGSPLASDRNAALDKVKLCAKRKADIAQNQTGPFLNRLRAIHDRLVDYIESDKKGFKANVKAVLKPDEVLSNELVRDLELLKFESDLLKENTSRLIQ